jgi:hypothetical protein
MTNYLSPLSEAETPVVFTIAGVPTGYPWRNPSQAGTGSAVYKCGAPSGDLRILPVSVAGYGGASKSCIQDDYTANDNHFQ